MSDLSSLAGSQDARPSLPERSSFHASLLLQLVEDLRVDFTHERSIRFCPHGLFSNRFLLTLEKERLGGEAASKLLPIWRRLGMPQALVATAHQNLNNAKFVHFGFEENETSCLYKVYLEFAPGAEASGAVLLHLAFKWDIADSSRNVQTQYIWHRDLNGAGIEARMAALYRDSVSSEAWEIARGIFSRAAGQPADVLSYLEVTEDVNGRRSFDLNMYDANLALHALEPYLMRMCRHFAIADESFQAWYQANKEQRFGHVAAGIHRNGQEFFNLYYGAERRQARTRPSRAGWNLGPIKRPQYTTEQDQYYNYCWWPYLPVAATENKLQPVNLLWHSFDVAGLDERAWQLVQLIRDDIGMFRTVWGVKWLPETPSAFGGSSAVKGRLAWEFYFYDYLRRERDVSITRLLRTIQPIMPCAVPVNEGLPYFMFSLDVNEELLGGVRALDVVHMYVGNPGSKVSSGIAYALTSRGTNLENFYFFFDAARDLREAAEKISASAYVDAAAVGIDRLLVPELRNCNTICVANKQKNDTVYFSGVNVNQLLFFLRNLHYPAEVTSFVEENRGQLDHLLYDVGFDYAVRDGEVVVVKSGYYGVF